MKIRSLMDFLNKESAGDSSHTGGGYMDEVDSDDLSNEENVVYIDNPRLETAYEQGIGRELLVGGTEWADQAMGELLVADGKIEFEDIQRIIDYQRSRGLYFGEAAVELKLASHDDILRALSRQFGYTYGQDDGVSSTSELVMASAPFGEQAEEFRSIRGQLLSNWLTPTDNVLAIVSPGEREGRSYIAANLAQAFSQLGRSTLLIDANLRSPRQQELFNVSSRIGLSVLLAGRLKIEDLAMLPDKIPAFRHLSILSCGAVPPNPAELLSSGRFSQILNELKKYFGVILIDTPPAFYRADILSIASVAGSALMVARGGHSKMEEAKSLRAVLEQANARVVGAVLNEF